MLRTLFGRVISNKMVKTVIVQVESSYTHPLYRKKIKIKRKYKAHDEKGISRPGDTVRLTETRPISKEKRWKIAEVITSKGVVEKPVEMETKVENTKSEA